MHPEIGRGGPALQPLRLHRGPEFSVGARRQIRPGVAVGPARESHRRIAQVQFERGGRDIDAESAPPHRAILQDSLRREARFGYMTARGFGNPWIGRRTPSADRLTADQARTRLAADAQPRVAGVEGKRRGLSVGSGADHQRLFRVPTRPQPVPPRFWRRERPRLRAGVRIAARRRDVDFGGAAGKRQSGGGDQEEAAPVHHRRTRPRTSIR